MSVGYHPPMRADPVQLGADHSTRFDTEVNMPHPRRALLSVLLSMFFLFTLPVPVLASGCPASDGATVLLPVLNYPLPSPNYFVQYKVGVGPWTQATTYINVYGATLASPYRSDSGYS